MIEIQENLIDDFMDLVKRNSIPLAEQSIKQGINVNSVDKYKQSALHYASILGFADMVELLLYNNATIDIIDNFMSTPLQQATLNKHRVIVEILLNKGS